MWAKDFIVTEQEILDNAPEGATHVDNVGDYFKVETVYQYEDERDCGYEDMFRFSLGDWIVDRDNLRLTRSLADIRRITELENQWISVEDRLPDTGRFLAIGNGCESEIVVFMAFVNGGGKFKAKGRDCSDLVTHWMPLPAPPELLESEK